MPNHMKFCGCKQCKAGRHRRKRGLDMIQACIRKFRRKMKQAIKRGDEPDDKFSVPYTD